MVLMLIQKSQLRLDQPDWTQESKLLIPGQPEKSEFFRRITTLDPDDKMPPPENPKSLSPTEIRILDNWIQEGADWDEHWAFITPKTPTPPEVENVDQVRNPIDSFIVKKLEEQGLQPHLRRSLHPDPKTQLRSNRNASA